MHSKLIKILSEGLKVQFKRSFSGQIFRMLMDDGSPTLVLEIRKEQEHRVTFAAIDLADGTLLWDGLQFEEPWRCGLETVQGGIAYFYLAENEDGPGRLGLAGAALKTGKVLFERSDLTFMGINGNQPIVTREEADSDLYLYDHRLDSLSIYGSSASAIDPLDPKIILFPHHYRQGSSHFDTVGRFLSGHQGQSPVGAIDYLEYSGRLFISYYIEEKGKLCNQLCVLDMNGTEIERFGLDQRLSAVGTDTFIITEGLLVFICHKNEINAYRL